MTQKEDKTIQELSIWFDSLSYIDRLSLYEGRKKLGLR